MNKGQTVIMLMVFMVVAVTITTAAVVLTIINSRNASRLEQGEAALSLAHSGGENAMMRLLRDVAINPTKQFQQSNNTKRRSDVNAILNAINQYQADNKGALPGGITATAAVIGDDTANGQVDLCATLVPEYIAALPVDPLTNNGAPVTDCAAAYDTNYTVVQGASDNRISIAAPAAELGETISVTR